MSSFVMRLDRRCAQDRDAQAYSGSEMRAKKREATGESGRAACCQTVTKETREPQYNRCLELRDTIGLTSLGLMTNQVWYDDPRRLTFLLARYKFVAKMLAGRRNVGEVGCGDAFGTRVVLQEVPDVTVYDFDPLFIEDIRARRTSDGRSRPKSTTSCWRPCRASTKRCSALTSSSTLRR